MTPHHLPADRPYALIRREGADQVELFLGSVAEVASTADIPLEPGRPTIALLPHRLIAERGFEVVDDRAPLLCLVADERTSIPLIDLLAALPVDIGTVDDRGFDVGDDEYAHIVGRVLDEEIGRGEGSNFVIHRTRRAYAADPGHTALACLRRLLTTETGAYWTFVVFTGSAYFVGASPERHVSQQDGLVMMNPISGTYRHPATGPDKAGLLAFLADPKEVNELAMVLDEELKMMAVVADGGGQVVGPYLKEMAHLAHTEYLLAGRSTLDVRDILRETMFAPTVTGSPIENACRVIARHEGRGRAYYGGVVALLDHDGTGAPRLDSTILIRTAVLTTGGELGVSVGATLVRDSTPAGEVAETEAKAAGVLAALGLAARTRPAKPEAPLAADPDVLAVLAARNDRLSPFWLADRRDLAMARPFAGRSCLIVDAEDTFTGMLAHMLHSLGMRVELRAYDEVGELDHDLVVAGPGPGDPTDPALDRVAALRAVIRDRRARRAPLLAVCLGHQVLCDELGLTLHRREVPAQGVPMEIDLFGTVRRVGYYSTFTAIASPVDGVEFATDATGFVHALRGEGVAGVQFHPESVLTEDGPAILTDLIATLLPVTA